MIVSELFISHHYERREECVWVRVGVGGPKKEEIKNFNRARGKYSTNQLHSAEITDELSTLLVIN